MLEKLNRFLDHISDFLAHRKGLLPVIGLLLIIINLILQFFLQTGWLAQTNFLLHLGVILAIIGFLLAWTL
jgi:uncharacterized membrane protein